MNEELYDDSFDLALATMELPPMAKIPRKEEKEKEKEEVKVGPESTFVSAKPNLPAPNPHCIWVHSKQRGNPILKSIQNVALEYRHDIVPDYVVGRTSCILYLSLKYHQLNPDYICQRIKDLGKSYELRVLLVQVDIPEPYNALKNLTRITLLTNLTFMLAWNADEAGKIIETYKLFEKKPPDMIMERAQNDPHQNLVSALTSIRPVNKTDAMTLLQNFGSLENIINASEDRLSQIIGLGPRKAHKLYKTLHEPFLNK